MQTPRQESPYVYCLQRRYSKTDLLEIYPATPWICPPVADELCAVFDKWGVEHSFKKGETVVLFGTPNEHISLTKRGIVGRITGFSTPKINVTPMMLSFPWNFATGNLNFFSQRPSYERYVALTDCVLSICEHDTFRAALEADPELMRRFAAFVFSSSAKGIL